MALIKARAASSDAVTRVAEGTEVYIKALRDGTLTTAAFFQALAMEGKMFMANAGTVTTPITFGAGSIDSTEPDLYVAVYSGNAIIPVSISILMEAYGTNAIFETMASFGTDGTTFTGAGGAVVTPANLKIGGGKSSIYAYGGTNASSLTYFSNPREIFRNGQQVAITKATAVNNIANLDSPTGYKFTWSAVSSGIMPVLIGPAQLCVYAAAQASTGFISFCYVELPASALV